MDVNARWVAKVGIVGLVQVLMQTRLRGATCSGTDPEFGFQAGAGHCCKGRGPKKSIFLGKSPKLWVGGGQES